MLKLAPTGAEELLEIVMRRHERASTMVTSNRLVENWGKLLGDSAAVTACSTACYTKVTSDGTRISSRIVMYTKLTNRGVESRL